MTLLLSGPRVPIALVVVLGYLAGCAWLWWRHRQALRAEQLRLAAECRQDDAILVLHASQTGQAQALAEETARRLQAVGQAVRLMPLGALDARTLQRAGQALFIASTTGDGDAPDSAVPFVHRCMRADAGLRLHGLKVAVLALGDRRYGAFCAFGLSLARWLQDCGAVSLREPLQVDRGDGRVIAQWWAQVAAVRPADALPASSDAAARMSPASSVRWTLQQRRCLNPGSQGGPL